MLIGRLPQKLAHRPTINALIGTSGSEGACDVGVVCASVSQMLDAHMFHKTRVCCCCSCKPLVSLLLSLYVLSVLFLFVLLVILLLCAARVCSLLSSMYGMFVMTLCGCQDESDWCSDETSTHVARRRVGVRFLLPGGHGISLDHPPCSAIRAAHQ